MRSTTILLATLLLMPLAAADEGHADCEEGQWWVGYRTTHGLQEAIEPALAENGIGLAACEGEQWDGQDSVQPDEEAPCTGAVQPDPHDAFAGACLGNDPNAMPGEDPLDPVGARASARDLREAYAAANVAFVGRVAVYGGTCESGDGLEGDDACGGTRELRTGVYVRDNTPGNFVVNVVRCSFSITCYSSENDCDHATYHQGAKTDDRLCSRDNTALGAALVLA